MRPSASGSEIAASSSTTRIRGFTVRWYPAVLSVFTGVGRSGEDSLLGRGGTVSTIATSATAEPRRGSRRAPADPLRLRLLEITVTTVVVTLLAIQCGVHWETWGDDIMV